MTKFYPVKKEPKTGMYFLLIKLTKSLHSLGWFKLSKLTVRLANKF